MNERPKACHNCRYDFKQNVNNVNVNNILSCKACNLVYFCDEDCKRKRWKQHQIPCKSIITLPKQQRDKVMHAGTYSSVLSVKDEAKMTSLVGESCLIDCQLNGQVTSLLLDTGAQVSIIDMEDLKNYHLNAVVTQQTSVGLQDVLKTSSRHVLKTSSTRLQRNNFTSSKTS